MKIAVECQSPLLQKSLELFLSKYLSSSKKCDIIVKDSECYGDKRCFYISSEPNADLIKPFSNLSLFWHCKNAMRHFMELKKCKRLRKKRRKRWIFLF